LEDFLYGYYYYGDSSKKGFFFARETNWHEGRSTLNDLERIQHQPDLNYMKPAYTNSRGVYKIDFKASDGYEFEIQNLSFTFQKGNIEKIKKTNYYVNSELQYNEDIEYSAKSS